MLADIEVAQSLQAQKAEEEEEEEVVAHPLDQDYALLCCQLSLLDPSSREHQVLRSPLAHRDPGATSSVGTRLDGCLVVTPRPCLLSRQLIQNYVVQTGNQARILSIWVVAREGEVRRRSCWCPPGESPAVPLRLGSVLRGGVSSWGSPTSPALVSP